jgi:hypothetical protein
MSVTKKQLAHHSPDSGLSSISPGPAKSMNAKRTQQLTDSKRTFQKKTNPRKPKKHPEKTRIPPFRTQPNPEPGAPRPTCDKTLVFWRSKRSANRRSSTTSGGPPSSAKPFRMKNLTGNQPHDGFVCSITQLDAYIRHQERAEIVRCARAGELDTRDRSQNNR